MLESIKKRLTIAVDLHNAHDLLAARRIYEEVLTVDPQNPSALDLLGFCLYQLEEDALRAEALVTASIRIRPQEAFVHVHLAFILLRQKKAIAASHSINRALDLGCKDALWVESFALELAHQGEHLLSLLYLQKAALFDPSLAQLQWNLALSELQHGLYVSGWQRQEARWQIVTNKATEFPGPRWIGQTSLAGKTILLWPEQGLGDVLQFCRYALVVQKMARQVLLQVPHAMHELITRSMAEHQADLPHHQPICVLIYEENPQRAYDFQTSLMSLPLACETWSENKVPYAPSYLVADPIKSQHWQKRLSVATSAIAGMKAPLKVGLVWAGGFKQNDASNMLVDPYRSLSLSAFAPLFALDNICFFSLQKGPPSAQWQKMMDTGIPSGHLFDWTADIHDWDSTAALAINLDLVISCDTSCAHLAAALGKPTWLLSRFNGCWRWLLGREDSPWYSTMRIFAQQQPHDWHSVMQRVCQALEHVAHPYKDVAPQEL